MNTERAKITAEVAWIRTRAKASLVLRILGIAIVCWAVFNAYGAMLTEFTPYAPYRAFLMDTLGLGVWFGPIVADHIVLGGGLVLAYWG